MNLKATDIHFLNVSEKTQSVLGEFYEPVFCEISLATLYTGLLVFVDLSDFLLLVLARNATERYDSVPV